MHHFPSRRSLLWILLTMLWSWTAMPAQPGQPENWNVFPQTPLMDLPVTQPPSPILVKSLGDAAEYVTRWKPPSSASEWYLRRPVVENSFRRSLGLERFPTRTALNPRILGRSEFDGYSVERLIFESRPGFPVTANVYVPASTNNSRHPAIVSPIGHFLTPGKTAPDVQSRCIQLSKLGFVVLVYDAIGQGERMVPGNIHHDAGYALLPLGETIAGWMVWDSMRALDYLLTRPDVDAERIGITGNSGGGLNTLFTAALDHRLRAATIVGFTFEFNNWIKYGGAHCTCTHLPGIFRELDWFEIAGLIAPSPVQMIQGGNDAIFPISGARRAASAAHRIYELQGIGKLASFVELPEMPHAYSRPYREQMYGWMNHHLNGSSRIDPQPESQFQTLPEMDNRLLCDPDRSQLPGAMTVLDYARRRGLELSQQRAANASRGSNGLVLDWARQLTAPPESKPHLLATRSSKAGPVPGGSLEKLSFNSEDGVRIPALLWTPASPQSGSRNIVVADDRGKAAVAESGWITPLLLGGHSILAVDLRGRGETIGRYNSNYDTSFRLVANQVLFGRPLAGRRGFDLIRSIDFLKTRPGIEGRPLTLIGVGDDALPALLAAATDPRVEQLVLAGYFHSFVSQMRPRIPPPPGKMGDAWNDPQLQGRLISRHFEIQFASVIPSALLTTDILELISLVLPRPVLFCQARDFTSAEAGISAAWANLVAQQTTSGPLRYAPETRLEPGFLKDWMTQVTTP